MSCLLNSKKCENEENHRNDPSANRKTGLAYDSKMTDHFCLWDYGFPESPARITESWRCCLDYGLVDRCTLVNSRLARREEITLQHSEDYIQCIEDSQTVQDPYVLEELSSRYDGIFINNFTWTSSLMSLAATIDLSIDIASKKLNNGFAIVRPPGHHAQESEACGYCFFNNVSIAATHLLDKKLAKRILIVDWDIHHGQGTQFMHYDDPRVLYFSIHRYERARFWPHLRESDWDYIGNGLGAGYNINVPLDKIGLGDAEYLAIFYNLLMPIAYEFNPSFVLISAGYDSSIGDEKGRMMVTPQCYAHLTHMLCALANGRVAAILEGGYCIKSLAEGVALTLRELLGDPPPMLPGISSIDETVVATILNVISLLKPYWSCLAFQSISLDLPYIPPQHPENFKFWSGNDKPVKFDTRFDYPRLSEQEALLLDKKIDVLIDDCDVSQPRHRTCLAYDSGMCNHEDLQDPTHPECPGRIIQIYEKLKESGLYDRCHIVKSQGCTEEILHLLHDPSYISLLKSTATMSSHKLDKLKDRFDSVYFNAYTYEASCLAVGNVLSIVDSVLTGESENGFAIVRPPGHHAECGHAKGFGFLNNVALAAKYAQTKYNVKKVLIVDWDVHHGNGTQNMFYEDASVLYISLHRFDHGYFYPCHKSADCSYIGGLKGTGYNINIAWNDHPKGDGDYMAAFNHLVLPVAYEFNPELVLVSCGFDSGKGDPLGNLDVSAACYSHMTHMLMALARGKVIVVLEGGYNITTIRESAAYVISTLLRDPCPKLKHKLKPTTGGVKSILMTIKNIRSYWNSLVFSGVSLASPQNQSVLDKMSNKNDIHQLEVAIEKGLRLSK